ncbi:MAG TPA: ABC transporter permease [Bacteroidia bacterium]|nr:ABC transporter permease [Bacteroidia bacterium]HRH09520.1 ABC transporter permease [Bacteroidia bacterium]
MKYKNNWCFPAAWDMNPFASKNQYILKDKNGLITKLQPDVCDWKKLEYEFVVWCFIPYSPGKSDYANANFKAPMEAQKNSQATSLPLRFWHFLGTGARGEDILAGMIHGCRISMGIGIFSMCMAACIGVLLGALAGYFGDDTFQISKASAIGIIPGLLLGFFYGFTCRSIEIHEAFLSSATLGWLQLLLSCCIFIFVVGVCIILCKTIEKTGIGTKTIAIPLDSFISRSIDLLISLPAFIVLISLSALTQPSALNLMLLIALTSWTGIARLTRAEFLRIKQLEYIQAAKSLGYGHRRILLQHGLRNAIAPAIVAIAFGIAGCILVESSLSFLGIGLPIDTVSWGSMLSLGRTQFSAWWLSVFPGSAIFLCVICFNYLGDALRELLNNTSITDVYN